MLRSLREQLGYTTEAIDGPIGIVNDFLLDGASWNVRYAVIDLGKWLPGRQVLIGRDGFDQPDWASQRFPLRHRKAVVEAAPGIAAHQPVSRQVEEQLHTHFGWVPYWSTSMAGPPPGPMVPLRVAAGEPDEADTTDQNLRSLRELMGYALVCQGERVGKLHDAIAHSAHWDAPFVVADVGGWFKDKDVSIPTNMLDEISFARAEIRADLNKDELEHLAEFDPERAAGAEVELCVYDYRGRLKDRMPL